MPMNNWIALSQSKAVEHPINTCSGEVVTLLSASIPAVCVDIRSIPIFTVVSRYRSHLQMLADKLYVEMLLGSGESRNW